MEFLRTKKDLLIKLNIPLFALENLDLNYESRAVFSYLQYSRNTSQLMPLRTDESVSQRWGVNITVGSPVIQLALFVPEYVWMKEANDVGDDNSMENNMDDIEGL